MLPPAFSIAATADFDARATSKATLPLSSPLTEDLHAFAQLRADAGFDQSFNRY